jgi:hypothetical protein
MVGQKVNHSPEHACEKIHEEHHQTPSDQQTHNDTSQKQGNQEQAIEDKDEDARKLGFENQAERDALIAHAVKVVTKNKTEEEVIDFIVADIMAEPEERRREILHNIKMGKKSPWSRQER